MSKEYYPSQMMTEIKQCSKCDGGWDPFYHGQVNTHTKLEPCLDKAAQLRY